MGLISLLASVKNEPSFFDGLVGLFLGGCVSFLVMWFLPLLLGFKLRFSPDPDWAKEAKKYNDERAKRHPWMVWLVGIACVGSMAATFLWYCGWQVPFIN